MRGMMPVVVARAAMASDYCCCGYLLHDEDAYRGKGKETSLHVFAACG